MTLIISDCKEQEKGQEGKELVCLKSSECPHSLEEDESLSVTFCGQFSAHLHHGFPFDTPLLGFVLFGAHLLVSNPFVAVHCHIYTS